MIKPNLLPLISNPEPDKRKQLVQQTEGTSTGALNNINFTDKAVS